ncbi:hypothetical protein GGTG_05116 [Gaeumannomyces tritici R3-111a-1]|uniref:Uncharacterized protein n=1 Tax=Gaeumannomyces tritici (strain R3-111a-1) TaxID=644352 RepID=J3NV07_GAET3|nr:hypothetical protein GGTG_05116 [Gaeumannomyces tritici R3-111a-1]EJT75179.1 hypothetical protein GGTG_05116 [Gaeumannomyces tritici R3-111a-1]
MKLLLVSLLAAYVAAEANTTVAADGAQEERSSGACYPNVCGWQAVNGVLTQGDLAMKVCGRSDTCGGQEWNYLYHYGLSDLYPVRFCDKGCYKCRGVCGDNEGCCH